MFDQIYLNKTKKMNLGYILDHMNKLSSEEQNIIMSNIADFMAEAIDDEAVDGMTFDELDDFLGKEINIHLMQSAIDFVYSNHYYKKNSQDRWNAVDAILNLKNVKFTRALN